MQEWNGTYQLQAQTEIGPVVLTVTFVEENGALTGTSDFYGSVVDLENGKVEGDTFTYQFWAVTNYGNYYLTVQGRREGDQLTGTMNGGTYVTFTGSRV